MKLKALMLAGAVAVAVAGSANAQTPVYSVNVVGFINLDVPPGFSMIANQLDNGTNTVGSLFPNVPNSTQIFKFNGTSFSQTEFITGLGWIPDGNTTIMPGEGVFIRNPQTTNMTLTIVGNVAVGTSTVQLVPGGFTVVSSAIPQSGTPSALQFPVDDGDQIFRFVSGAYQSSENISALGGFIPSTPTINIGESFFVKKAAGATGTNWVRTFTVQ